jgi:hypothetical protein
MAITDGALILPPVVLPEPPSNDETLPQAQIRQLFAQYYWKHHFESSSVDPVSFLDRILTDYSNYDSDIVGQWLNNNMQYVYKAYRACLAYGIKNGTVDKARDAKQFQSVYLGCIINSSEVSPAIQGCKTC